MPIIEFKKKTRTASAPESLEEPPAPNLRRSQLSASVSAACAQIGHDYRTARLLEDWDRDFRKVAEAEQQAARAKVYA